MSLAHQILLDSPIAYWPMDETAGSTLTDRSGNGHDGTWHGGIGVSASGPSGMRCVTFDGAAGSYISVPSSAAFASHAGGAGVWSFEVWLYRSLATTEKSFFSRGTGSTYEWLFEVSATDLLDEYMIASAGAEVARDNVGTSLLNRWQHVAGSYDRGAATFISYLDGVEVTRDTTMSGSMSDTSGLVYIGTRNDSVSNFYNWNGRMAQMAVYPSALSADRIKAHYQAGRRAGTVFG